MTTLFQHQYIANWHDSFVHYIGSLRGVVAGLMERPEATEEDKRGVEGIWLILNGRLSVAIRRIVGMVRKMGKMGKMRWWGGGC